MTGRPERAPWRAPAWAAVLLFAVLSALLVYRPPADAASEVSTTGVTMVRIPGVLSGQANAIAPNGIVVGQGTMSEGGLGQASNVAWIWRGGGTGAAERINPNYGPQGGVFFAAADDVNAAGQVVGTYDFPGATTNRAFRWSSAAGLETFGPGPGTGGVTNGVGISESGEVVGYRSTPTGSFRGDFDDAASAFEVVDNFRATSIEGGTVAGVFNTWTGATLTPLDPGSAAVGLANAINSGGALAGYLLTKGSPNQAATWSSPTAAPSVLGTLGGAASEAHGINGSSVVVGSSQTASGEMHAFVWTADDGMRDLGTLGGNYSKALDVNDSGLVVGAASDASGVIHAVVWDLNGTFDPDLPPAIDLIPPQDAYGDETLTISPSISDPEGDAWTVTWQHHGLEFEDTGPFLDTDLDSPLDLGATQIGSDLVWTPPVGTEPGTYVLRVTATQDDNASNSSSQIVFIQLPGQDRVPRVDPIPDQTAPIDVLFQVDADATDPDGDPFTFGFLFGTPESPVTAPAGASIDSASGLFSWTPTLADVGTHTVTISAGTELFPGFPGPTGYTTFQLEVTDDDPPTAIDVVVSETITVADDVTITLGGAPLTVLVAETIEVTDTAAVAGPLVIEVNEQIEVSDDVGVTGPLTILVTEQVDVLDDVRISGPLVIEVNEQIEVSDDVGVTGPLLILVAEQIDVSDAVTVTGPLTILVTERVDVSDAFTAQAGDDGDGIGSSIDGFFEAGAFTSEADLFSARFTDQHLGGATFGEILNPGDALIVDDAVDAGAGVRLQNDSAAASAIVEACAAPFELTLNPATGLTYTCGSITVTVDTGSASVPVADGVLVVPAGATVTIDELGGPSISTAPQSSATPVLTIAGIDIPIPAGTTFALVNGCIGDVNGDGVLDSGDLQTVLRALFTRPGDRRWNSAADVNRDGIINGADLRLVSDALIDPDCQDEPPPACVGDIDGDGRVTEADSNLLFQAFRSRPGHPRWNPDADLNGDLRVNGRDLQILLEALADPACR